MLLPCGLVEHRNMEKLKETSWIGRGTWNLLEKRDFLSCFCAFRKLLYETEEQSLVRLNSGGLYEI